jgi:Family of unknown function (DUF5906)
VSTPIEQFCSVVFGEGATEGDVAVLRADDEKLFTRDPDEIAEFIGDAGEAYVSMQTRDAQGKPWEQPAIATAIDDLSEIEKPPSILLRHAGGDLFGVWLIECAPAHSVPRELTEAAPLPGTGGWSIAESNPDLEYKLSDFLADEESIKHNDAVIIGTLDPAIMQREVQIGFGTSANQKPGTWRNVKTTVGGMVDKLSKHEEGQKDGACFLQGSVIDGERRANAIEFLDFIGIDVDGGQSRQAIEDRIRELGLFAIFYTTHSHLKPVTDIKKDAVVRWLGSDQEPDVDQVIAYLIDVKRYDRDILEGAELLEQQHTKDGVKLFIRHKPMPKFRILLLLKERFVIAKRALKQSEAIREWHERYSGASKLLGAFFDRSCVDPSRLFYMPRHPKGAVEYAVTVIAGDPLDIDSVERLTAEDVKRGDKDVFTEAGADMSGGPEYKTVNMKRFAATYGDVFDIETFMLEKEPDGDRGPRNTGAGRSHRCPNDDQHSDAGNEEDKGCFVINGTENDGRGFGLACMHDSCRGLDRLGLLDRFCEKVDISDALDLKEWCPELVEEEAPSEKPAQTSDTSAAAVDIIPFTSFEGAKFAVQGLPKDTDKARIASEEIKARIRVTSRSVLDDTHRNTLAKMMNDSTKWPVKTLESAMKFDKQAAAALDPDGEKKKAAKYPEDTLKELGKMNKRYAVLKMGGKVRIIEEPEHKGDEVEVMETTAFSYILANKPVLMNEENGLVEKPIVDVWTKWPERRTYRKAIMEPYPREGTNPAKPNEYNFWSGFAVRPRKTTSWDFLRSHVYENLCHSDREWFHFFMTWCAQIIQQPQIKLGSSLGIGGERGTGKSKFFDWFVKLIGDYHAKKVNTPHYITGHFNALQAGLVLLVCEEAVWAGDARSTSVLKDLITSEKMMVERKGIDAIPARSAVRLAFISNEDWFIPPALEGERRFFVLEALNGHKQDIQFFKAVDEQMANGGAEAMMHELEDWRPDGGNWDILRTPPETKWLKEQARETLGAWDNFFITMAIDGGCWMQRKDDDTPTIELAMDQDTRFSLGVLRHYYNMAVGRSATGRYKIGNDGLLVSACMNWLSAEGRIEQPTPLEAEEDSSLRITVPPLRIIRRNLMRRGAIPFEITESKPDDPLSKAA